MDKRYLKISFLILIILSGLYACQNYGKVLYESPFYNPKDDSKMTISKLMENWRDYNVYYSGVGIAGAEGIMFDPVHDKNTLTGDYWKKINDQETFEKLMDWTIGADPSGNKLYRISGPGNELFGFIYAPNEYMMPVAKVIDTNTLYIYRMMEYERMFNLL